MLGFWKPTQRRVGWPHGQCVRTCYASLLDLPIDAVPDFSPAARPAGSNQLDTERAWLRSRGLKLVVVPAVPGQPPPRIRPDRYHLMSVMTTRSKVHGHRVVGRGGKIVHDPHPGGTTVTSVKAWLFVVPL